MRRLDEAKASLGSHMGRTVKDSCLGIRADQGDLEYRPGPNRRPQRADRRGQNVDFRAAGLDTAVSRRVV